MVRAEGSSLAELTAKKKALEQHMLQCAMGKTTDGCAPGKETPKKPGAASNAQVAVGADGEVTEVKAAAAELHEHVKASKESGALKPFGPEPAGPDESQADKLMKAFKAMDADGTGQIDTKDMHKLMEFWGKQILGPQGNRAHAAHGGASFNGAPESVVQDFVSDMDADGDGKVEFKDYVAFATKVRTSPSFRQMLKQKRDMAFLQQLTTSIPELGKLIKEKKAEYVKRQQSQAVQVEA